jgi:Short repeat of unknown function (DUF308)
MASSLDGELGLQVKVPPASMTVNPIAGAEVTTGRIYRGGLPGHAVPMATHSAERGDQTSPLEQVARHGWELLLGLGIVSVLIGVVILVWPNQTLRVVGVPFGIYLLVSGVVEIIVAFTPGFRSGWSRFFSAVAGALSIFLGLISFRGAAEQLFLLALWIGFGWLFTGISARSAADRCLTCPTVAGRSSGESCSPSPAPSSSFRRSDPYSP